MVHHQGHTGNTTCMQDWDAFTNLALLASGSPISAGPVSLCPQPALAHDLSFSSKSPPPSLPCKQKGQLLCCSQDTGPDLKSHLRRTLTMLLVESLSLLVASPITPLLTPLQDQMLVTLFLGSSLSPGCCNLVCSGCLLLHCGQVHLPSLSHTIALLPLHLL